MESMIADRPAYLAYWITTTNGITALCAVVLFVVIVEILRK